MCHVVHPPPAHNVEQHQLLAARDAGVRFQFRQSVAVDREEADRRGAAQPILLEEPSRPARRQLVLHRVGVEPHLPLDQVDARAVGVHGPAVDARDSVVAEALRREGALDHHLELVAAALPHAARGDWRRPVRLAHAHPAVRAEVELRARLARVLHLGQLDLGIAGKERGRVARELGARKEQAELAERLTDRLRHAGRGARGRRAP
mmetsp:Transcript_32862/g.108570  ORF Transcript_32862/g.108570 Transcript_32862/m.108570 type:complete len:206 (+) Transcript_32862:105-722(+)